MSCDRHTEIDLAAYAADARSPEFDAFREHFPTCAICAPLVAEWIALRSDLAALDAAAAHPEPGVLEAFAQGAGDTASRRTIDAHLSACAACRTELRVLRDFEWPAAPSASPSLAAAPSWLDRLRESLTLWMPEHALAAIALTLLVVPVGWFVWRLVPEKPTEETVAVTESVRAAAGPEEFAAAPPGEPEIRVAGDPTAVAGEIPDDDPKFDEERPFEIGFNDTGFPGFTEKELAGMPEPSLELEPVALADPLEAAEVAESGAMESESVAVAQEPPLSPEPSLADPDTAPIQIASLLPSELPRYVSNAALAGGSLESLRLGSAIRGSQGALPRVQAMAPDHVAAVESATPTLYWWLSGASDVPVELTLVGRESGETLIERRFAPPVRRGLHGLGLSQADVRLPEGSVVEWYVALVVDETRRELDVVSNAALRFAPPAAPLVAEPGREAHVRAAAGYWIDAFAQLTRWIEAEPESETLQAHRTALATQAGLEAP
jgi:hypothetical protein